MPSYNQTEKLRQLAEHPLGVSQVSPLSIHYIYKFARLKILKLAQKTIVKLLLIVFKNI